MTNNVENLVLEHLRALRAGQDRLEQSLDDLKLRMGQVEEHIAGMRRDMSILHADIVVTHKRLDTLETRVERIERRLDLVGGEPR